MPQRLPRRPITGRAVILTSAAAITFAVTAVPVLAQTTSTSADATTTSAAQAPSSAPADSSTSTPNTSASGTSASSSLPPAPRPERNTRLRFGPQVGVYMPMSNKTRDRFGDTWLLLGLGVGNLSDLHQNRHGALDISVLANSRSGENAWFVPIGLSYSVALSRTPDGKSVGYAGVSGDLVVAHLRSAQDNLASTTSLTGGGGAFIGTRFGESGYVEARYNAIAPTHGFDLSGVTLMTGLRF